MTPKQQRFVEEYLIDLNATQAAIRAGYSEKTAYSIGQENLTKPEIAKAIETNQSKRSEKVGLTAERVLQELSKIVFFDPRKLFDEGGNPIHVSALDDDTAGAIGGVDVQEEYDRDEEGNKVLIGYVKKYKVWDKNSALEKAMKHLGIAGTEKHEHDFTGLSDAERAERIAAILEAARSRRT